MRQTGKHGREAGERNPLAAGLTRALESSRNTFFPDAHIEMNGNREATLEGCRGILEYTEGVVRLSADRMIVRFVGRDLELRSLTSSTVVVTGFIASVEFST